MKKNNNKGFTLMEMLIVVAIIAVLVAIAIPTFTGSITKAKEAADVANLRAAYAEAVTDNLTTGAAFPTSCPVTTTGGGTVTWTGTATNLTVGYVGTYTTLSLSTDAVDIK